jgi:S1-C subfamily serine protease
MAHRFILFTALNLFAASQSFAVSIDATKLRRSVFKIYVDSQEYQPRRPWKQSRNEKSSGSGFHVGDGRIMTNAHVVANSRYLALLRDGESEPTPAFVEFIAHDCDLAVIKPVDASYLQNVAVLPFGDLPKVQTPVATVGYARGGEQVSVTEGVVSRIEYRRYVHSGFHRHLLLQVDSAINPGNSGGPVFQDNKVVGVAFQANTSAENTGYVIPNLVIQRFLRDIADGKYDGHPEDGMTIMTDVTRSDAMRRVFGLKPGIFGIQVVHIVKGSSSDGVVQVGDVLIEVDGRPIGSDGKISFEGERIDLNLIHDLKQIGESTIYTVLRDRKILKVDMPVKKYSPPYLPANDYRKMAKFTVFGGHIFTAMTRNLLLSWGQKWYEKAPLVLRYAHYFSAYDSEFAGRDELIVYLGKLAHSSNSQSSGDEYSLVASVNQLPVNSIRQLDQALDHAGGDLVRVDFHFEKEPLVISRSAAGRADEEILTQYGVSPREALDDQPDGSVGQAGIN